MRSRPELRGLGEAARMEWFRARARRWENRTLAVVILVCLAMFAIVAYVLATKGELPPDPPMHYDGRFGPG